MSLQLSDLPLELFFLIFSYLHIQDLLKLDHLSRQLHGAISAHLATLKQLTLLPPSLDRLRTLSPTSKLTDDVFTNLLERCPQLDEITSVPLAQEGRFESFMSNPRHGLSLDGVTMALSSHASISSITVCTSAQLATALFHSCQHVSIKELNITGVGLPDKQVPIHLYSYTGLQIMQLENVFVENLPSLPLVEKIVLTNVCLQSKGVLGVEFPSLKHFSFHGKFSSKGHTLADILALGSFIPPSEVFLLSLSQAKALESLTIPVDVFGIDSVKKVAEKGGLPSLKRLQLIGSSLFISTIGDVRALESVAMLIRSCAASLEFLNLPSTVCFHSFYLYFSSKGIRLPHLQHFEVNAYSHREITDDNNRVGLNLFSDFLLRIPNIRTLSLIGYDGPLASLLLPARLVEITVPWRNQLRDWQAQCEGICNAVDTCLSLKRLVITGLEIDALESLAELVGGTRRDVSLELRSETLEEFSISNSCIHSICLLECQNLRKFSLHCCPVLKKLRLPASSIDQVSIYDQSSSTYIIEFLRNFCSRPDLSPRCYMNIQLHDIRTVRQDDENYKRRDTEKALKMKKVTESLVSDIGSVIKRVANVSSCLLTRTEDVTIQHSSSEQLFCCTEFHPDSYGRVMETVINSENLHRSCVSEAVQQWIRSLAQLARLARQPMPSETSASTTEDSVSVSLFEKQYDCWTNIPCMLPLNAMLTHTDTDAAQGSLPVLNIPHPSIFNAATTLTALCDSLGSHGAGRDQVDKLLGLHQALIFITLSHYWHVVTILYDY